MSGPLIQSLTALTAVVPHLGSEPVELCGSPEIAAGENCETPASIPQPDSNLWLYRDRTVAILRRYLRLAIEVGRLPSLLGREFFRTRVTSYHTQTFEDSVIFVHDMERCLEILDAADKGLIAMIVLQEHSQEETARRLRCTRRTIVRHYPEALGRLSEILLEREILLPLPDLRAESRNACQEGGSDEFPLSDSC